MKKVLKRIGIVLGSIILILALTLLALYVEPMTEGARIKSDTVEGSADWMANLSDDALLSQVTLPGTHDSATAYVQLAYFSKCQGLSIGEQLEAGYRYLDIRLGIDYDENQMASMALMHGFTHCKTGNGPGASNLYLDSVLEEIYQFLDEHPTECVVFVVKQEHGDESVSEFETLLNQYVQAAADYWYLSDEIPTVGEARGKIVLCRRYADEAGLGEKAGINLSWVDQRGSEDPSLSYELFEDETLTLLVQDRFEYKAKDKWTVFCETMEYINNEMPEEYVAINFMSTKGTLKYGHPHHYSNQMNKWFSKAKMVNFDRAGWVIVDFGTPELAELIYGLNF